jgi:type I restriction enzyme S subunit
MKFRNGVNADKHSYGAGVPFVNVLEVIKHSHIYSAQIPGRVTLKKGVLDLFQVRRGDLIFNRTSETQEEVGLSAVYLDDEVVVFGGFVIRGRPNAELFDATYSGYAFRSPVIRTQITAKGQGAIRANIGQTDLGKVFAPMPPLPEQRAIAAALFDVDALITGLDQLIAKKRDVKQAAMQQLLTGKKRLPGFSGDWVVNRLGDVASFHKGKGLPKSAVIPYGGEPCIHYGELFTRYGETIGEIISRTNGSRSSIRSVANDVLMPTSDVTPSGLAKASCITIDGVVLGGDILVIRPDVKRIHGSFLSYVIRYEEDQVLQLVTGSTVFHLYGSDMKKFSFAIPSYSEQVAIVAVLSDMTAEIAALEQQREKTRDLKQGMMQELLTGRIRLVLPVCQLDKAA